ncbi:hypothetical protein WP50_20150 [Lactiplantibacillus plantarum]|nr:hypothetical protein WP50_20150 [Lactiplantibacillus plantarum]
MGQLHTHRQIQCHHSQSSAFSQTNDSVSVTLKKHINASDDNYPGNMDVAIKFTLDNQDQVSIAFTGDTDAATLFNPTNRVYWNTTDDRTSLAQQKLQITSAAHLEFDDEKVPTGKKLAVMTDYQRVGYCLCQSIGRVAASVSPVNAMDT